MPVLAKLGLVIPSKGVEGVDSESKGLGERELKIMLDLL